jgi:hypothetical protein
MLHDPTLAGGGGALFRQDNTWTLLLQGGSVLSRQETTPDPSLGGGVVAGRRRIMCIYIIIYI